MGAVDFAALVAVVAVFGAVCMYVGYRVGAADRAWYKQRLKELEDYLNRRR